MKRFVPVLTRINERLLLPQPQKYRIIKELAADLEDTFSVYLRQGMGEDEAEAKALEKIAADDSVIEQLMEIHETPARKLLRRFSAKMRRRVEIILWIFLLSLFGMYVAGTLTGSESIAGSYFNWFTGVLIISMFGIAVSKFYGLFIKRDHTIRSIHRGLPLLIFFSYLAFITGTLGFFVEMQGSIETMMRSGAGGIDTALIHLARCFSVISFGFASATAGAVVWLILTMKIMTIEDQEQAVLLSGTE